MRNCLLLLFFSNASMYAMYLEAIIKFVESSYMSYESVSISQNIPIDRLIKNIKEEPCSIDVQCNKINKTEGTLLFTINLINDCEKKIQAIVPVRWNERAYYNDSTILIICSAYPVLNS